MKKTNYSEISKQKLEYLKYSEKTIINYISYINKFLNSVNKYPSDLTSKDFQYYLDNYKFTSVSQQNQIINAIKFLYRKVLNKKYNKVSFERPRKEKKLPRVIDSEFIISKLNKIENKKHKAILTLCFSVGLRVSEIVNLKIEHIDKTRQLILIKNAKGNKDRYVPLSPKVREVLIDYYLNYKPTLYLFNGNKRQNSLKYSIKSCQNIYKKYIDKKTSIHTMRHSCATTLLERGVNLRTIQSILGHSNVKTTEIYTHVAKTELSKINLPI